MGAIQNAISGFVLDLFGGWAWAEEICVLICSMIPIIELRGGIPMAFAFGLKWWQAFLLCVVGNILPVPIILLFIKRFLIWAEASRIKILNKLASWLNRKVEKNRPKIEKFAFWGLTVFVGIPLPMTGAWTGSLVAAMIDMKFWKAMLTALLGVLLAATIVTVIVYGGIEALSFLV